MPDPPDPKATLPLWEPKLKPLRDSESSPGRGGTGRDRGRRDRGGGRAPKPCYDCGASHPGVGCAVATGVLFCRGARAEPTSHP